MDEPGTTYEARESNRPRRTSGRAYDAGAMKDRTTLVVQRYLDALADDVESRTRVRELLDQAAERLHLLCSGLLHRSYPRLTRAPVHLAAEDLLSAVVARLLKALRAVQPANVRQFFALANRHMRWELNDLARRLDEQPFVQPLGDQAVATSHETSSAPSPNLGRILQAIGELPDDEREVFELVRIQALSHTEAAALLEVSTKTVQRRLNRGLLLLVEALPDLRPGDPAT